MVHRGGLETSPEKNKKDDFNICIADDAKTAADEIYDEKIEELTPKAKQIKRLVNKTSTKTTSLPFTDHSISHSVVRVERSRLIRRKNHPNLKADNSVKSTRLSPVRAGLRSNSLESQSSAASNNNNAKGKKKKVNNNKKVAPKPIDNPPEETINSVGDEPKNPQSPSEPSQPEPQTQLKLSQQLPLKFICSLPLNRLSGILENLQLEKATKCPVSVEDETLPPDEKSSVSQQQNISQCKTLCLYCDKRISTVKVRARHIERFHTISKERRSSTRNPVAPSQDSKDSAGGASTVSSSSSSVPSTPKSSSTNVLFSGCSFCSKSPKLQAFALENDLSALFYHLVDLHSDKYFGCKLCAIRFQNAAKLGDHVQQTHAQASKTTQPTGDVSSSLGLPEDDRNSAEFEKSTPSKTRRQVKQVAGGDSGRNSVEAQPAKATTSSATTLSVNRNGSMFSSDEPFLSRLGVTQNRLPRGRKGIRNRRQTNVDSVKPDTSLMSVKTRSKVGRVCTSNEPIETVFRTPTLNTRTEPLSCTFDEDFYEKVFINVRTNLSCHLDGKLGKNLDVNRPQSPPPLMPAIRSTVVKSPHIVESEVHTATSLSALTAFPTLLTAEQYGCDFGTAKIKRPITKHSWKWKWDSVKKYKYVNEGGKIVKKIKQPMLGLRDLSKLDMWTQLTMRQKHEVARKQAEVGTSTSLVEAGEFSREEKQRQIDQLNTILDSRRLPQIILEQNEQTIIKLEISDEGYRYLAEEFSRGSPSDEPSTSLLSNRIIPANLNLIPKRSIGDSQTDKVVLSGEWARPRCYVCFGCGARFDKLKALEEHKMFRHPHVYSTHYEIVGRELIEGNLYKHFFIPMKALNRHREYAEGVLVHKKTEDNVSKSSTNSANEEESLDSLQSMTASFSTLSSSKLSDYCDTDTKTAIENVSPSYTEPSALSSKTENSLAIVSNPSVDCTKCSRNCHGMLDLYRHMLDCSGDYAWILAKKKKYRYYGSRRRRQFNKHNIGTLHMQKRKIKETKDENEPEETPKKKSSMSPSTPRPRPSDADSIRKMLENLPPKRVCREIIPNATKPRVRKFKTTTGRKIQQAQTNKCKSSNTTLTTISKKLLRNRKLRAISEKDKISRSNKILENKRKSARIKSSLLMNKKAQSESKVSKKTEQGKGGIVRKIGATTKRFVKKIKRRFLGEKKESTPENSPNKGAGKKAAKLSAVRKLTFDKDKEESNEQKDVAEEASSADPKKDSSSKSEASPSEKEGAKKDQSSNESTDKMAAPVIENHTSKADKSTPEQNSLSKFDGSTENLNQQQRELSTSVEDLRKGHQGLLHNQVSPTTKRRSKKINDCIAMLTGKLQEKLGKPFLECKDNLNSENAKTNNATVTAAEKSNVPSSNEPKDTKVPKRKAFTRRIVKCDPPASTVPVVQEEQILVGNSVLAKDSGAISASEPIPVKEPVPVKGETTVLCPIPSPNPIPVKESGPVLDPIPVQKPVPGKDPVPVKEPLPCKESIAVKESVPATPPIPVIESSAAKAPIPVKEPLPCKEPVAVKESVPAKPTIPLKESIPAKTPIPVKEPTPVKEPEKNEVSLTKVAEKPAAKPAKKDLAELKVLPLEKLNAAVLPTVLPPPRQRDEVTITRSQVAATSLKPPTPQSAKKIIPPTVTIEIKTPPPALPRESPRKPPPVRKPSPKQQCAYTADTIRVPCIKPPQLNIPQFNLVPVTAPRGGMITKRRQTIAGAPNDFLIEMNAPRCANTYNNLPFELEVPLDLSKKPKRSSPKAKATPKAFPPHTPQISVKPASALMPFTLPILSQTQIIPIMPPEPLQQKAQQVSLQGPPVMFPKDIVKTAPTTGNSRKRATNSKKQEPPLNPFVNTSLLNLPVEPPPPKKASKKPNLVEFDKCSPHFALPPVINSVPIKELIPPLPIPPVVPVVASEFNKPPESVVVGNKNTVACLPQPDVVLKPVETIPPAIAKVAPPVQCPHQEHIKEAPQAAVSLPAQNHIPKTTCTVEVSAAPLQPKEAKEPPKPNKKSPQSSPKKDYPVLTPTPAKSQVEPTPENATNKVDNKPDVSAESQKSVPTRRSKRNKANSPNNDKNATNSSPPSALKEVEEIAASFISDDEHEAQEVELPKSAKKQPESGKQETTRVEPMPEDKRKTEATSKEHQKVVAITKDQQKTEAVTKDQQKEESIVKDQQKTEDIVKDKQKTEPIAKGQQKTEAIAKDQQKTEATVKGQQKTEAIVKDQQKTETIVKGQQKTELFAKGQQKTEPVAKGQQKTETVTKDQQKTDATAKPKQNTDAIVVSKSAEAETSKTDPKVDKAQPPVEEEAATAETPATDSRENITPSNQDSSKKPRRRRKNELAAIVADQLLESFKEVDKSRIDDLKKLENLAYEKKNEDLLLTGMRLMPTTKRKNVLENKKEPVPEPEPKAAPAKESKKQKAEAAKEKAVKQQKDEPEPSKEVKEVPKVETKAKQQKDAQEVAAKSQQAASKAEPKPDPKVKSLQLDFGNYRTNSLDSWSQRTQALSNPVLASPENDKSPTNDSAASHKKSKKKQMKKRDKKIEIENINQLRTGLESFTLSKDVVESAKEDQSVAARSSESALSIVGLFTQTQRNAAGLQANNREPDSASTGNLSSIKSTSSILRPSILAASLETATNKENPCQSDRKSSISSRDPRLNKNIHTEENEQPAAVAPEVTSRLSTLRQRRKSLADVNPPSSRQNSRSAHIKRSEASSRRNSLVFDDDDDDKFLTAITQRVNEHIMSAEDKDFNLANDGFDLANSFLDMDDPFGRPSTSMSVRSAPNFNDDRSNMDTMDATNTDLIDMEVDDDMSVYTTFSQDTSRSKGRRRRRRRSVLLTRKPKKTNINLLESSVTYDCQLCNKKFAKPAALNKHQLTIAHVSKVSEQEYLNATRKKEEAIKQSQLIAESPAKQAPPVEPSKPPSILSLNQTCRLEVKVPPPKPVEVPEKSTERVDKPTQPKVPYIPPNSILNQSGIEPISSPEQNYERYSTKTTSRLTLNPDERLFYECCNILKGSETPLVERTYPIVPPTTYAYDLQVKPVTPKSTNERYSYIKQSTADASGKREGGIYPRIDVNQFSDISSDSNPACAQPPPIMSVNYAQMHVLSGAKDQAVLPNDDGDGGALRSNIPRENPVMQMASLTSANTATPLTARTFVNQPSQLGTHPHGMETATAISQKQNFISPLHSASSQSSTITTTTCRLKTKAAMKGYDNLKVSIPTVGLDMEHALERSPRPGCKLTTLAEIALGNETPMTALTSFTPAMQMHTEQKAKCKSKPSDLTVPFPSILSQAKQIQEPAPKKRDKSPAKQNSPIISVHDTESCMPIALSSPKKPENIIAKDIYEFDDSENTPISKAIQSPFKTGDDNEGAPKKAIIIPERPFKNIGMEEQEGIKFQKPETPAINDENTTSTVTYSDRDDFVYGSISGGDDDNENEVEDNKEENVNSAESSNSSAFTAKTFENKSLIMGRIFKNAKTKPKIAAEKPKLPTPEPPKQIPKQELDRLFDTLRGLDENRQANASKEERNENAANTSRAKETTSGKRKQASAAKTAKSKANASKTPKKPTNKEERTSKEMAQLHTELGMTPAEIAELLSEGQRKSQRRCAVNRPKKLVEIWSSDEFEEFLSTKDIIALIEEKEQKTKKKRKTPSTTKKAAAQPQSSSNNNTKPAEDPKAPSARLQAEDEKAKPPTSPQKSLRNNSNAAQPSKAATAENDKKATPSRSKKKVPTATANVLAQTKAAPKAPKEVRPSSRKNSLEVLKNNTSPFKKPSQRSAPLKAADDSESDFEAELSRKSKAGAIRNRRKTISGKLENDAGSSGSGKKVAPKQKPVTETTSSPRTSNNKQSSATAPAAEAQVRPQARRKRIASEMLYYWSSSSDEEFGRIESTHEDEDHIDESENYQQHGWIVGDSHKKLVTLLAIAKGNKKVDDCGVKEANSKKKS